MHEMFDAHPAGAELIGSRSDALCSALLDSRQRWRDLVGLVADLAFETDQWGRFVFVYPDPALDWASATLIGQPAELLVADATATTGFNPFRPTAPIRRRRAWVKRADGSYCCLSFFVTPLVDDQGGIVGARGVALDVTENSADEGHIAAALRRGEVLDHVLWRMRQEVLAPRMMHAALDALMRAVGAEGGAVVRAPGAGQDPTLLYQVGIGADATLPTVVGLLGSGRATIAATTPDQRPIVMSSCDMRPGEQVALALWRRSGGRAWDAEEELLVASSSTVIRVILEHDAIQDEMHRQARTDALTGLFNRRAFFEELDRHIPRLEREELPGTLMFLDLDHFKTLNDRLGHQVGDQALLTTAALLRNTVRPTDLVARFGGDEFAVWLNGADHLTAAERAEALRVQAPRALADLTAGKSPPLTMSIGIATRSPGSVETIESVMRRADEAMYEVKRSGRGYWLVSPEDPACL